MISRTRGRAFAFIGCLALLVAAGCGTTYSVKLEGDVVSSYASVPGVVPGVYPEPEAKKIRDAGGAHLQPLDGGTLNVRLKFKDAVIQEKGTSITAVGSHFSAELSGTADSPLEAVSVGIAVPGRPAVERLLPTPLQGPVLAVVAGK
jgi:hypothetical protein